MDTPENKARLEPIRLGYNSKFQFECHKGVSCFTKCCRGIKITLTPYDIIRLKNRLELSSEEFLAIYTDIHLLEKTDLPVVTLKLLDDELTSCPFVKDEGCIIYEDRPTTCRYYPLGVATLSQQATGEDEGDEDEFFFFVKEPHCKGFDEPKEWTVAEWRRDQGVDIHDDINAGWTDLIVRKRSFPQNVKLSEKSKKMFFTACYDIDKFKRFVFESSFLDLYKVDAEEVEKMREDEIALLEFGYRWLKSILYKEGDFEIDKDRAMERAKERTAQQS